MGDKSGIEWTDATWNPTSGCTRVSAGCDHCYAVKQTARLEKMGQKKYAGLTVLNAKGERHFNGTVRCHEDALALPLRWKKPRRIFVNSMSDLFHKEVPFEFVDKVFAVMALCPEHIFQILTKRPQRMAEYSLDLYREGGRMEAWIEAGELPLADAPDCCSGFFDRLAELDALPNVWLGTSVENQAAADERIPDLLKCPAAVRFLSCEPLLGEVVLPIGNRQSAIGNLHWVIAGGESGAKARPMKPEWARSLRDQCQAAGIPFFFKQWGEWLPGGQSAWIDLPVADGPMRLGKHGAGRLLDGRTWEEFPANLQLPIANGRSEIGNRKSAIRGGGGR